MKELRKCAETATTTVLVSLRFGFVGGDESDESKLTSSYHYHLYTFSYSIDKTSPSSS